MHGLARLEVAGSEHTAHSGTSTNRRKQPSIPPPPITRLRKRGWCVRCRYSAVLSQVLRQQEGAGTRRRAAAQGADDARATAGDAQSRGRGRRQRHAGERLEHTEYAAPHSFHHLFAKKASKGSASSSEEFARERHGKRTWAGGVESFAAARAHDQHGPADVRCRPGHARHRGLLP